MAESLQFYLYRNKALGVPAAAAPRSTKHAACDTAPVCIRTDDTHARRQTLPLRRWSTPHGAERPLRRRPLRRHRALQHGRPTRASYWRTPHAHAHCLELHIILLSFACTHACLAQTLYSRRILLHASIRDTKLAHALKRFRLHRDHTATKTCMCLPRTLTQSLYTTKSLFSRTQPIPYP